MCSPSNDAAAVGAGGFGELDRGRGERQGRRDPGKRHLLKEAGGADMRVVERLLRGIDLSRHDIGRFERGQSPAQLREAPTRRDRNGGRG